MKEKSKVWHVTKDNITKIFPPAAAAAAASVTGRGVEKGEMKLKFSNQKKEVSLYL